ncbi:MAG: hypothetical protein IPI35_21285 [Deltaproteobacteria bacterium]|nr:hypothetical protein [Deltaproteobacteria bacterium]
MISLRPAVLLYEVAQTRKVGSKSLYYYSSTFDLTADGVSDLVITWDQVDRDVGNKPWLVYEAARAALDRGDRSGPCRRSPGTSGRPAFSPGVSSVRTVGSKSLALLRHDV